MREPATVIPFPRALDAPVTLDEMQRSWLQLMDDGRPWSASVLIACLPTATDEEAEEIISLLNRNTGEPACR